jgi:hypothetical protein
MNPLQQYQFWIGLGFGATLVLFLIIAFFKAKDMTWGQWLMLKILSAICGAVAGILISGDALVNFIRQVPGGKFTISGTAGFAVFFAIWFFFPKRPEAPPPAKGFNLSVKRGWKFQEAADTIAKSLGTTIEYEGFTSGELSSPLKTWELECSSPKQALERLGSIVDGNSPIRKYKVSTKDSVYILRIR